MAFRSDQRQIRGPSDFSKDRRGAKRPAPLLIEKKGCKTAKRRFRLMSDDSTVEKSPANSVVSSMDPRKQPLKLNEGQESAVEGRPTSVEDGTTILGANRMDESESSQRGEPKPTSRNDGLALGVNGFGKSNWCSAGQGRRGLSTDPNGAGNHVYPLSPRSSSPDNDKGQKTDGVVRSEKVVSPQQKGKKVPAA